MSKKKNDDILIDFSNSGSAEDVTGTNIFIKFGKTNILLDCGLIQGGSVLDEYKNNKANFKYKAKEIDYVLSLESHTDHLGRIPLLYARGCSAPLYIPQGSGEIRFEMLSNSAMIIDGNSKYLTKKFEKDFEPLYTQSDVDKVMGHHVEVPLYETIYLQDDIRFKYISSGHISFACSLILEFKVRENWKKIYYTSDIGGLSFKNYYVNNLDKIGSADLILSECTYGSSEQSCNNKEQREKDKMRMKNVIEQYDRVLYPVFSLHRAEVILTILWEIFHEDKGFKVPIYLDSILLNKIADIYKKKFPKFNEVMQWENVHQIDKEQRRAIQTSNEKCIILSSSGMGNAGAVVSWIESMIQNPRYCCVWGGYCAEGTLGWKLKLNEKEQKTITINGKTYKNKMQTVKLRSLSSHIQHDDLLDYLSSINTPQVVLHHGSMMGRLAFKYELEKAYEKLGKTTKVSVANKSMKIHL